MKILLFLPNYIGDVLMTTPAIRVLKKVLPEAKLFVAINEYVKEVISSNPYINGIIYKLPKLAFLQRIRDENFNYVILFRTTFFNSFSTFIAKPEYSVGFNEEFSHLFLSEVVRKNPARPYRYECIVLVKKLFTHLGINHEPDINEIKKLESSEWYKDEIINSLKQKLVKNKVALEKPIVTISPFATRQAKMLTAEQYIDIINSLYEIKNDINIILVGQIKNEEQKMVDVILQNTKNIKSLCNQLSLKELTALCGMSKLVISVDTGVAYISESVGTPTVIIFTSTLPEKYGPFSENVKFIYSSVICSPCYKNECPNKTYRCRYQLNVKEIVNIAEEILVK